MNTPTLTFFNNKGGVGKTSLIYHLAWMFASLDKRVVIFDLDPQANLTASFLVEEEIEQIWSKDQTGASIYQCLKPLTSMGDIVEPALHKINDYLYLLPGDVNLSSYEDALSNEWPNSMNDNNLYRPMRIISAFWQLMQMATATVQADIVLTDIGPNLGAINRSALLATDYVAIPLGADLFSLQGLKNLGPTLKSWRSQWQKRLSNWEESQEKTQYPNFRLPQGTIQPIGYLCQQPELRLSRPVKAYNKWVNRIPEVYRQSVMDEPNAGDVEQQTDPYCLATVKHYRSLIPMGQEHRKPIFQLTSADGAIGSHLSAVRDAKSDFKTLAEKIAHKIGVNLEQ